MLCAQRLELHRAARVLVEHLNHEVVGLEFVKTHPFAASIFTHDFQLVIWCALKLKTILECDLKSVGNAVVESL